MVLAAVVLDAMAPIVLLKLAVGGPLVLYGLLKVTMRMFCSWCPTITIVPDRGVRPFNPNPF